jgi:chromatin remodeling complex protein RSC6
MLPLQPLGPLVEIVGHEPQPRTEVTKRVWAYIRENRLQVRGQPRLIECDEKLLALTGQDRCDMFELTNHVTRHLADPPDAARSPRDWSDEELRAAVDAYRWMQEQEHADKPYSKVDVRVELNWSPKNGRHEVW